MKRSIRLVALACVCALVLAACGGGSDKGGDDDNGGSSKGEDNGNVQKTTGGETTVHPLFYYNGPNGPAGGSSEVRISLDASGDDEIRVSISESEVGGTGDQWKAASWNAMTVATILTGSSLVGQEVQFDVSGRIDGPSAGALMTIGVISLIRGDEILDDITMTGTINPDGTVGPVGGIPYKIDGVVDAGKDRMLIPVGLRNAPDGNGNLVDMVQLGKEKDVEVIEVADIYEAYELFTGEELPRPTGKSPSLDEKTYQALQSRVTYWQGQYDKAVAEIGTIQPEVLGIVGDALMPLATMADEAYARSNELGTDGLQAGAYQAAIEATAYANAVAKTGRAFELYLTQGASAFLAQIQSSAAISSTIDAFVDSLDDYTPETVSDAATLIGATSSAIDAVSAMALAEQQFEYADFDAPTEEDALTAYVLGAIYYELAGVLALSAEDLFRLGQNLGGAELDSDVDLNAVASFFRKASEANLAAFEADIVKPEADAAGLSVEVVKNQLAAADTDYGLALIGQNIGYQLQDYFGTKGNAVYAQLGGAVSLYARSAGLLAKYYSLGEIEFYDGSIEVVGAQSDRALAAAIELARDQLAGAVSILTDYDVNPALAVASYESGTVQINANGATVADKLNGLTTYWGGFVNARVLTYLGGFPTAGLE